MKSNKNEYMCAQGTSLVIQGMQETQVWSLTREDPIGRGTNKPEHHNYWACALGLGSHNHWGPHAETTGAVLL